MTQHSPERAAGPAPAASPTALPIALPVALPIALTLACALLAGCQDRRDPVKPTVAAGAQAAAPAGR
jgi:hypothetical protein